MSSQLSSDVRPKKPEEEQELNRFAAFKATLQYAKPHRKTFAAIALCTILAISADLLQPYLVKITIDDHLAVQNTDIRFLVIIAVIYTLLSLVSFLFTYVQNNLLQFAGQNIIARIRKDLFSHITRMSMPFFDRHHSGSLVTNVSSDTETISQFFTQVLMSIIRDGMTLLLIIFFMFKLDVTLAWFSLSVVPIIIFIAAIFRKYLRRNYQLARSRLSRLIGFIAENVSGMGLIQAFRQEKEQYGRFTEHNESYWQANKREIRAHVLFNRTFDVLGNLALVLMVWLGGLAVLNRQVEVGVLYAFISYIRQFFQPINQITMQWNTFQSTTVSMERIWKIMSNKSNVADAAPDQAILLTTEQVRGQIDFYDVSFGYQDNEIIIPRLNLHIEPGEMVGVVGTTGAGKSTMISLLNRFYDVRSGRILIDGVDIRHIPQNSLHRIIGLVQQDPYMFSGSIIDNVRLFREDITREQVIEACQFVGAHSMIMRLRDQYDTLLTERGSGLSAGERQLISFARIVVFQPKILILDEATANLDSHTEQLVQHALNSVAAGRTTIVIAHRLSTVMHADRIIVMKDGQIVEQGTHHQLLSLHGYYENLYNHAFKLSHSAL
ncbi:ABC transporter ATP-binding protein [Paenibacillus sediminis]|uniref:ATP-binding cassette subfamily B protein n=1 Tax=Paenibacillus sediminis TaxID=664909 RepID=A0ABS4H4B7_9BACL|nr:ABC transporter ATP-binding protein [Paenibacillus sediminis]MBP1937351.1 ATP-binding cassette subfamily B protein [Paenibacillus sediminis]